LFNRIYRPTGDEVTVKITHGDNLRSVATELEKKQIIYNKYIFIFVGRVLGYQNSIIPGEYKFSNGLTNIDVLKMITDVSMYHNITVTIPEGMNVRQIGHLLSRQLGLDSASFVQETYNDSLIGLLNIKAENLIQRKK
jgi:cell division protein YceG involved in septum cleavage